MFLLGLGSPATLPHEYTNPGRGSHIFAQKSHEKLRFMDIYPFEVKNLGPRGRGFWVNTPHILYRYPGFSHTIHYNH